MQLPKEIYRYKNESTYYTSYFSTTENKTVQVNLGNDKEKALKKLQELRQELTGKKNISAPAKPKPEKTNLPKDTTPFFKRNSKLMWLLFIVALVSACIGLRLYGFTSKPLWLDEVVQLSYTLPGQSFSTVIAESAAQAQPPLDYLITWQIRKHIPYVLSFRIPYLIYSVLSCIFIWLWAKRIFSRPGIVAVGCWLAISGFHIFYAQEVRVYGLMILLSAAYYFALDTALRRRNFIWWFLCMIISALSFFTNVFSLFIIGFSGIYVLCFSLINLRSNRSDSLPNANKLSLLKKILFFNSWPNIIKWIAVFLCAIALFYPYYNTILGEQIKKQSKSSVWNQNAPDKLDFKKIYSRVFTDFAAKPKEALPYIQILGVFIILGLLPRKKKEIPFCVTAVFVLILYPGIIAYVFSKHTNTLFKPRYICQAFPFFAMALGAGVIHAASWLSLLIRLIVPSAKKDMYQRSAFNILLISGVICIMWVELPATLSQIHLEKSPWRIVADNIRKEYKEYNLITSQLDVALRWNLNYYLAKRKNWEYIGLEELPKLYMENPVRVWIIVDKRKMRVDLGKVTNTFEVSEIDAFYPSIYLFKSKSALRWQQTLNALQPFSDKMDTYAIFTRKQYEYLGQARLAVKRNNYSEGKKAYDNALRVAFKKDIWINLEFARFLRQHKNYSNAIPQYEIFFNKAPKQYKTSVLSELIDCYDRCGKEKAADKLLRKYGTQKFIREREFRKYNMKAEAALKELQPDHAYQYYLKALDISPSNSTICRALAEICYSKHEKTEYEKALQWNKKADDYLYAKTKKRFVEAMFNSALIYELSGKYKNALKCYNEILKYLISERPVQRYWLFKTHEYLGAIHEKSKFYNRAAKSFSNAEIYADTPKQKRSVSNHIARINSLKKVK